MEIKMNQEEKVVKVFVSGSITSSNAGEFASLIDSGVDGTKDVTIDMKDLDYISSAGLRVLLSLKKRLKDKNLTIVNVSSEVKNIFDVTGFSDIMDVRLQMRQLSIEGCTKIGAGACGEVYRLDEETIIKLYYPWISNEEIEREKELSKKAFVMGVPTAISYDIAEVDGRKGVVYELINSKTLGELIRNDFDNLEHYVDIYVDVCKTIHSIDGSKANIPEFKEINRLDIKNLDGVSEEEIDLLNKFLDMVPYGNTCIHGDLNINNIMVQNNECVLIDMGEFSTGIPLFDISRIVFSFEFAAAKEDEFNSFYKMPQKDVNKIYEMFMKKYFNVDSFEEIKQDKDLEWLYPLSWFRTIMSMMKKNNRWSEEKNQLGRYLLREKLIPFIKDHLK